MKIRTRIGLVAVAVALPQLAGLVWFDGRSRHAAAEAGLTALVTRAVGEPGAREACLADPEGWTAGFAHR
ncbi:MAG: hypothetical protein ABMB14_40095, partial [Myxococcota bacterium]